MGHLVATGDSSIDIKTKAPPSMPGAPAPPHATIKLAANMPSQTSTTVTNTDHTTKSSTAATWKQRAAVKREQQASQIPPEWRLPSLPSPLPKSTLEYIQSSSLLTPLEHEITSTISADALLARIRSRDVSSVQVATAFCKRAAIAQQLSRCCTEMFFEKALDRARALDRHLEEKGEVVGPLHGLPVSLKDSMDVEGEDSSVGESVSAPVVCSEAVLFVC